MSCCLNAGHFRISGLRNDQCGTFEGAVLAPWEGRVLNKVLYGEAPPWAQTLAFSSLPVYAQLAPLADFFLRFFPTLKPVHRLPKWRPFYIPQG